MMDVIYSDADLLPLSGIQHFAFCRRQWALIHLEQQWQENLLTFGGREMHERADDPFFTESRGRVIVARSLPLVSYRLGLYGIADVVEFEQDETGVTLQGRRGRWLPHPVEYKYGKPKRDDRDFVQVCAQGICLEEMFTITVVAGDLYYGRIRKRETVKFDQELRERVAELATEMHQAFAAGLTPRAEVTPACKKCSLLEMCLPELAVKRSVSRYLTEALRDTDSEGGK
jgi:CRISPR-associated exonuclease Cas4